MKMIFRLLTLMVAALLLSSCSLLPKVGNTEAPKTEGSQSPTSTVVTPEVPKVTLSEVRNVNFELDTKPVVVSSDGDIQNVILSGDGSEGAKVERETDKRWLIKGKLHSGTNYVVNVTVKDAAGNSGVQNVAMSTVFPEYVTYTLSPSDGGTYGVGMPITVTFQKPVTNRREVENQLKISASPTVSGSWAWLTSSTVAWRPDKYWPANATIQVDVNLKDQKITDTAYGQNNLTTTFHTGSQNIIKVTENTRTLSLFQDGTEVLHTAISMGGEKGRTLRGTSIITEKLPSVDTQDPTKRKVTLTNALRFSTAPMGFLFVERTGMNVGKENYTFGTIALKNDDGQWLYNAAQVGDPVEISSSGAPMGLNDGPGGVWSVTPQEWHTMSAIPQ